MRKPDIQPIRGLLSTLGWTEEQVEGQIEGLTRLEESEVGFVAVAIDEEVPCGFVTAELYVWNRLVQIHGLAVAPEVRRRGVASDLVSGVENFARTRAARGVYVDTPTNNEVGRAFYLSAGYEEAYVMPRYYSDDLDGITFIKFLTDPSL